MADHRNRNTAGRIHRLHSNAVSMVERKCRTCSDLWCTAVTVVTVTVTAAVVTVMVTVVVMAMVYPNVFGAEQTARRRC